MSNVLKVVLVALAVTVSSACFSCNISPNDGDKCPQGLIAMYPKVIKQLQAESKSEGIDAVVSPDNFPEDPACLKQNLRGLERLDCKSLRDVLVSVTELPSPKVVNRIYGATLIGCTGQTGSSCYLYHRVYLIVESSDIYGNINYELCSGLSCP